MRVAMGVHIGDGEATIALLVAGTTHRTISQSRIDLADDSTSVLRSAVLTKARLLTQGGRHLASIRICGADPEQATRLAEALAVTGLDDVAVIPETSAMATLATSLSGGKPVAVVTADADTASLSIIDDDSTSLIAVESFAGTDRLEAYLRLLTRFRDALSAATSVIVLDASTDSVTTSRLKGKSRVPLVTLHAPDFAIARGAALAVSAPLTEATETTVRPPSQRLAYSEVDDDENTGGFLGSDEMPSASVETVTDAHGAAVRSHATGPNMAVWGSALAAFAVASFAALAVIVAVVAVSIRPEPAQQAVRAQKEAVPGKFFPMAPGQGTRPDPNNWAVVEKRPPAGEPANFRTFEPVAMRPSLAVESAPIELKLFSDGTLGLGNGFDPAAFLPPITIGATSVAAGGTGITGMDLVARLVPDFSSVDMTAVIVSLINNVAQADVLGTMAATLVSLNNAGSIGIVRSDQTAIRTGEPITVLSDPPGAILTKVNSGEPGTALAAAPTKIAPVVPNVPNVQQSPLGERSAVPAPAEVPATSAVTGPRQTLSYTPEPKAPKDSSPATAPTTQNPGSAVPTSAPDTAAPVAPPTSDAAAPVAAVQTPEPITVARAPSIAVPPPAAIPAPAPPPAAPPTVAEAPAPPAVVDIPASVEPIAPPTTTPMVAPSTAES